MNTEAILMDVEGLSDPERVRRMIAVGQAARTDPETAAALESLAAGDFYERRLALLACSGSRNGALPLRALADPSRLLRGLALSLVPILCTDAEVVGALQSSNEAARRTLLGRLVRRGRSVPVDAFLETLAAGGDPVLGLLLPCGTPDLARRHLGSVSARFGMDDWQRLARRHPDTAFEALMASVTALTAPDTRLRGQINAVLPLLAESRPARALELASALRMTSSLSQIMLQPVADRLPNEVCDLVLASDDRTTLRFDGQAHKLAPERLLALAKRQPDSLGSPARWLRRLGPETRRAAYTLAGLGWRTAEGVLEIAVAALLPGDIRAAEGQRNLALPALQTRPASRLPYAALLPWDEARGVLDSSVRSPDPDLRTVALSAQVGAARYDRTKLPEALAVVRACANEQDPIRRAMLAALAALPPARWKFEYLDDLGQIIRDALSAADLSPATAREAERLVVAQVPFHPEWASAWLATLAAERGQVHFGRLGDRLNDADVRRIAPALTPVLRSWETRERERVLLAVGVSLGRRLRVFPELAEMLERVLAATRDSYTASAILSLLAEHRPDRLPIAVPALVRQDPSTATLPGVYNFLHRRRQDLLTPFLGRAAYTGRFSTGKTRFVLPLTSGFERWTPAQTALFAQTLTELTAEADRDAPTVLRAIGQLAALPGVLPARLTALARPAAKPAVRDAALRALARLDGGEGVPVLVEALGDERARIAIYALRTALLEMPAAAALTLLQAVPMGKVTLAKEVVRLIGDLKTPGAYPALLELDAQDLHRDVRVALLRALWEHLEEDETWPRLESAAADPEPAIAGGVVRIPTDRLSRKAQSRLVALIAVLLGHPDPKVRLDVLARCRQLPLPDPARVLMPPLLAALGSRLPDESAAAARAVFATYTGESAGAVGGAFSALLPNRRTLHQAVAILASELTWQRERMEPTVRAVLAALETDRLTASLRVALLVVGLPWDDVTLELTRLAETESLSADVLASGVQALAAAKSRGGDSGLERLETTLAASAAPRLRRFALEALTASAGTAEGWTAARRKRLETYRRDPDPLVAAAAQFTFPPEEAPI